MNMIDFDIALLHNASKISHNAHSTSLFSLATVKCIRTGDYSESTLFKMALCMCCASCPYSANPQLDYFCHVMKSITKNKHPEVCVCGVRVSCLLCLLFVIGNIILMHRTCNRVGLV